MVHKGKSFLKIEWSGAEARINVVIEKAKPVIQEVLTALGYELVDIEYKPLYGDMHLIVYAASEKGISLDDCEAISNALDGPLDELDPTAGAPYCLDVSSPGLDRPFKTQRDFERNYGQKVEVKLYAPIEGDKKKIKLYVGILISHDDAQTVIECEENGELTIDNTKIALVRPYIEF